MIKINKVAVVGAGIMGNGIAQVLAQSGFQVSMVDIDDKALQRGFDSIKKSLGRLKKKVEPPPRSPGERTPRWPPWCSTSCLEIVNPTPSPP